MQLSWAGHSFFTIANYFYLVASGSWDCGAVAEMVGWFQVPWARELLEYSMGGVVHLYNVNADTQESSLVQGYLDDQLREDIHSQI